MGKMASMSLLPNSTRFALSSPRPRGAHRRTRPWASVGWRYSSIFLVALLLLGSIRFTEFGPNDRGERTVSFRVTDGTSGAPLPGARVELGGATAVTDRQGIARFLTGWQEQPVRVSVDGYAGVTSELTTDSGADHSFALQPLQRGAVASPASVPEPTAATTVVTTVAASPEPVAASPVASPAASPAATPVEVTAVAEIQATPDASGLTISGTILTKKGRVISGTYVRVGDDGRFVKDGKFSLSGVEPGATIEISAPGFEDMQIVAEAGDPIAVTLRAREIRAVYLSGAQVGDPAVVRRVLRLADRTEINAVVVDIKEYSVFYETKVRFFQRAGMVIDAFDPKKLVKRFHDHGLYVIARQVVFKDPLVAEHYTDLAVKNKETGDLWRGNEGEAWVNPFLRDLWEPNIELAKEAAGFGFDEIQYDYIRFPSDGDLTVADFGPNYDEEGRVKAIARFLKASQAALKPLGVMLAVDVFGVAVIANDDQGIGQRLADMAPYVDYICPMIYPSHFTPGIFGFDREPNALPYETIQRSLEMAKEKLPGQEHKIRPWLQDFTLGEPEYGPDEVRAQIDATEDEIGYGYMLWNAAVEYTEDALREE
jgi:hypothetical protein